MTVAHDLRHEAHSECAFEGTVGQWGLKIVKYLRTSVFSRSMRRTRHTCATAVLRVRDGSASLVECGALLIAAVAHASGGVRVEMCHFWGALRRAKVC